MRPEKVPFHVKVYPDTLDRFKSACKALGLRPSTLVEHFMDGWSHIPRPESKLSPKGMIDILEQNRNMRLLNELRSMRRAIKKPE